MPNLTDLQSILLSTASQRDDRSLFPVPDAAGSTGARLTKALASLIKRGLAEERETNNSEAVHRTDGDLTFGLFITDAGLASIGAAGEGATDAVAPAPAEPGPAIQTKSAAVIALLSRDQGATLAELIAATGWLAHTTRAALTGLRKKGHVIERSKRDDATCYRIAALA